MTKGKFKLTKVAWLMFWCFGIAFFSANNSQATPIQITLNNIIAQGPSAGTPYLTQYWLDTEEFGVLDAFCVEKVPANSNALYELVKPVGLDEVAGIASRYFDGSVLSLSLINNQTDAKVATQLLIWEKLGIATTSHAYYRSLVDEINNSTLDFTSISSSIYLATSPRNTGGLDSQDYLVSVPDASIMFLLGPALLGLGLLGRRKFHQTDS